MIAEFGMTGASGRQTLPSLRHAPSQRPDARGSRRSSPPWRVAEPVKQAVWRRDDFTCCFCGFRSQRYQEVLVLGGNSRDPDQMTTVCLFCHQCQHLELAASMRSGVLLWLPEIEQSDLNAMVREIYLAMALPASEVRARKAIDALLTRRAQARQRFETDDPGVLGRRLRASHEGSARGAPGQPGERGSIPGLQGLRLLALDRRILRIDELEYNQFPQVLGYWRSADGPYGPGTLASQALVWLTRLEAILPTLAERLPGEPSHRPDD